MEIVISLSILLLLSSIILKRSTKQKKCVHDYKSWTDGRTIHFKCKKCGHCTHKDLKEK